jgi:hypothetical protein
MADEKPETILRGPNCSPKRHTMRDNTIDISLVFNIDVRYRQQRTIITTGKFTLWSGPLRDVLASAE